MSIRGQVGMLATGGENRAMMEKCHIYNSKFYNWTGGFFYMKLSSFSYWILRPWYWDEQFCVLG